MNYWLFKSEPGTFSVDDLAASPKRTTFWDGVRNYQARNFMRNEMKKGGLFLSLELRRARHRRHC